MQGKGKGPGSGSHPAHAIVHGTHPTHAVVYGSHSTHAVIYSSHPTHAVVHDGPILSINITWLGRYGTSCNYEHGCISSRHAHWPTYI
ncbi:hypothetical protein EW026_g5441 [Hermanssonia centrifuga]|uniref:Uncharacterized protein n=1 Tax=Hermanssonia centrifuga TaxID=98765 RepID=A0A4S4KIG4_9APHY|nr:hypothetical protein EW026_g5441 [Hermanssonia centrifuga]